MCSDERKYAVMKGCFCSELMNFEEIKGRLSNWYVKIG